METGRPKQLSLDLDNCDCMLFIFVFIMVVFFFFSYLDQMFFCAEASRHKVPAVKVNRNKALFFPPPPGPALSPCSLHLLSFSLQKQGTRTNEFLI